MKRFSTVFLLLLAVPFLLGGAAPPESVEELLSDKSVWSNIEQSFYGKPMLYYSVRSADKTVSGLRNKSPLVPVAFRDSIETDAPVLGVTLDRNKIIKAYVLPMMDLRDYEGLAAGEFRLTDFLSHSNTCDYTSLLTAENETITASIKAVEAEKTYYLYKAKNGEGITALPKRILSDLTIRRQLAESDLNLRKTKGRFIVDGRLFSDTALLLFTDGSREYLLPTEDLVYQAIYSGAYPSDEDLSGRKELAGRSTRAGFSGLQLYQVPELFGSYAPVYETTQTLYQLQKEAFERTYSPAPDVGISADEAPVSFQTREFIGGTVTMSIPTGFGWMTPEAKAVKYPSENAPEEIVTNTDGTVNLAISELDTAITKEDVYPNALEIVAILKQSNPGSAFGKTKLYNLDGDTAVATIEFVNAAYDTDIYNLMFISNAGNFGVLGSINCPVENSALWKPYAIQMIKSIKDNTAEDAKAAE